MPHGGALPSCVIAHMLQFCGPGTDCFSSRRAPRRQTSVKDHVFTGVTCSTPWGAAWGAVSLTHSQSAQPGAQPWAQPGAQPRAQPGARPGAQMPDHGRTPMSIVARNSMVLDYMYSTTGLCEAFCTWRLPCWSWAVNVFAAQRRIRHQSISHPRSRGWSSPLARTRRAGRPLARWHPAR